MTSPTLSLTEYRRKQASFRHWLSLRGSAIFATSAVECFLTPSGKSSVYYDSKRLRWEEDAGYAYSCFIDGSQWKATIPGPRIIDADRNELWNTIASRDGLNCMYCYKQLTRWSTTIEHLVPISMGGTSHPANLTFACYKCNSDAGSSSVREKLEMAIQRRITEAIK